MALDVGSDFKTRWLAAPHTVQQSYLNDLKRVSELLDPATDPAKWSAHDQAAQQQSFVQIEQAYAHRKAELIEQARLRKQQALEQSLAEKRALANHYAQSLLQDEQQQFEAQTLQLRALTEKIQQDTHTMAARYEKVLLSAVAAAPVGLETSVLLNEENLKIRLELEADSMIEQVLEILRDKLQSAAQDEIAYLLKQHSA